MAELSPEALAIDSKRLQASLQSVSAALAKTSLDTLASAIGKDDTQVSRIRSGQLGATVTDFVKLLHAAGLKAVPLGKVCVDRDMYHAMVTVNAKAMSDEQTVRRLTWDE